MEIRPFPVIHYPFDQDLLAKVVCPPYDKLVDSQIASFRALHPHNYVRAIIGETLSDHSYYAGAATTLRDWVKQGVLVQEEGEQILISRQSFNSPLTGQEVTRTGFFALLRLPERGTGGVLPHERTFAEHKADRLMLYRAVKGNPEAIFVLYSDPDQSVLKAMNLAETKVSFTDPDGHHNELALLSDTSVIDTIRALVEPQNLLIADGHHRFETGQNYRDECRASHPGLTGPQPWDFILVYFTALEDPGLVILPTHRLVKGITSEEVEALLAHAKDFFDVEKIDTSLSPQTIQALAVDLAEMGKDTETLGLVTRESLYLLHLRDREKIKTLLSAELTGPLRDLPVVWLHRVVLDRFLGLAGEEGAPDRVAYVRTPEEVHSGLQSGGFDVAFLLRGTHPEEVKRVAIEGLRMPQKSTDFYPKVPSGLTACLHPE